MKKLINKVGFSIQKFNPYLDGFYIREHIINHLSIKNIIDVGANDGTYAEGIFKRGYIGKIYSFEPVKRTFNNLNDASKDKDNWKVFNYALSNTSGTQKIFSVDFSPECSLLQRRGKYLGAKEELITLVAFDEWVKNENLDLNDFWFKIDVEGYEKFVLEGSKTNLHKAAIVELELSPLPRFEYEDDSYQTTLSNMIAYMNQHNFDILHMDNPDHYDREKGKLYLCFVDVIFIRNDLKERIKGLF